MLTEEKKSFSWENNKLYFMNFPIGVFVFGITLSFAVSILSLLALTDITASAYDSPGWGIEIWNGMSD